MLTSILNYYFHTFLINFLILWEFVEPLKNLLIKYVNGKAIISNNFFPKLRVYLFSFESHQNNLSIMIKIDFSYLLQCASLWLVSLCRSARNGFNTYSDIIRSLISLNVVLILSIGVQYVYIIYLNWNLKFVLRL